jgi:hypothetical protein
LMPLKEGTEIRAASDDQQVRALFEGGLPISESVLRRTAPKATTQLALFGD